MVRLLAPFLIRDRICSCCCVAVLIAICAVGGICRFGKKANEKAAADAVAAYKESLAHDDGTAAQESKE